MKSSLFLRSFFATLVNYVAVGYLFTAVWLCINQQWAAALLFLVNTVLLYIIDVLLWLEIFDGL